MHRHTQQIGGVTVTFTAGHVNELRGESPVNAQGAGLDRLAPHDWLCSIPGIPVNWPVGVLSFHENGDTDA